jgi:hypothetical protein
VGKRELSVHDDDDKKMMASSLILTTACAVAPNQEGEEKVSIRSHFLYNENVKQQKN